jgi:hypothetical protein
MPAPTDQTSITIAHRAAPGFIQDPETRSWVMSGSGLERPSRAEILRYAQSELAKLRRLPPDWDGDGGVPLNAVLANLALSLVGEVTVANGLATPQFSPSPDGGLTMTWLVDGDRLTISLDLDEVSLSGTWAGGQDAFRFVRGWGIPSNEDLSVAVKDARAFLQKISTGVQHQLLTL